ncbi:MAG: hypothetical protein LUQ37_10155 [Methanoregulaceae archaeon]|nr:hypothetical protein [Methanoregulaceae archaeon]
MAAWVEYELRKRIAELETVNSAYVRDMDALMQENKELEAALREIADFGANWNGDVLAAIAKRALDHTDA